MATNPRLEQRIADMARQLSEEFGQIEEEPGECLMTQIEDFGAQLGDAVATRIMEQELEGRRTTGDAKCPHCNKLGRAKGDRKRPVLTKRGSIEINEPEFYCSSCRRSFFPGVQEAGDDAGSRLESTGAGEDDSCGS